MAERTCSVCERKHYARGYCKAHYKRVVEGRGLNPDVPLRELPTMVERDDVVGRILERCRRTKAGCLEWTGRLNEGGYGTIGWQGKHWLVHRAIWTVQVGPLPAWPMVIDHLCRNRACVDVTHMEVVHQAENAERGGGRLIADALRRQRTTCSKGHDREVHERVTPKGYTYCRACRAEKYQARKGQQATMVSDHEERCPLRPAREVA